jgi:flagellar motility protein MotE (MotC chaperone)
MKWKRSKKAQQEARSKNSGDNKHRNRSDHSATASDASKNSNNFENKNNETEDEDLDMGDEDLDEEIEDEEEELDVGEGEHKDISHLLPHFNSAPLQLNSTPSGAPPPLHLLRDALPGLEGLHNSTNLSSMLPPHLARMGSGPNSRFYRPFVA